MTSKTLIIGVGSMGKAILQGALEQGLWGASQVDVLVRRSEQASQLEAEFGITAFTEAEAVPNFDDYETILFCVKPQVLPTLLQEMGEYISDEPLCVSIAAGMTMDTLASYAEHLRWVRVMPNTPILVKAGFTAITKGLQYNITKTEVNRVHRLFSSLGEAVVCTEEELDRIGAIAGAGPAYMYTILDSIANGGVRIGLSRSLAVEAAIQTMYGASRMAMETGAHPCALRDQVTSPGGTTIAGLAKMEKEGLRTALMEGIEACYDRSLAIGKQCK